jgi:hypothetical protein
VIQVHSIDNTSRDGSLDNASKLYTYLLSTIQSPAFSKVEVVYLGSDFRAIGAGRQPLMARLRQPSQDEEVEEASQHRKRFELLREMHKVRGFRLVLYAYVWESDAEYVVQLLREAVAAEKARGGFNDLFPEPSVTFFPCRFLSAVSDS